MNLLGEKDNGLQLFSLSKIQTFCKYTQNKKAEKEQYKKDIDEKKIRKRL